MIPLPTDPRVVILNSLGTPTPWDGPLVAPEPGPGRVPRTPQLAGAPAGTSLVCTTCNGLGWIETPDPILGDLIDADCPTCWEATT